MNHADMLANKFMKEQTVAIDQLFNIDLSLSIFIFKTFPLRPLDGSLGGGQ